MIQSLYLVQRCSSDQVGKPEISNYLKGSFMLYPRNLFNFSLKSLNLSIFCTIELHLKLTILYSIIDVGLLINEIFQNVSLENYGESRFFCKGVEYLLL